MRQVRVPSERCISPMAKLKNLSPYLSLWRHPLCWLLKEHDATLAFATKIMCHARPGPSWTLRSCSALILVLRALHFELLLRIRPSDDACSRDTIQCWSREQN